MLTLVRASPAEEITISLTLTRGETDITVELTSPVAGTWLVTTALDEDGRPVKLSKRELARLVAEAESGSGADETGL